MKDATSTERVGRYQLLETDRRWPERRGVARAKVFGASPVSSGRFRRQAVPSRADHDGRDRSGAVGGGARLRQPRASADRAHVGVRRRPGHHVHRRWNMSSGSTRCALIAEAASRRRRARLGRRTRADLAGRPCGRLCPRPRPGPTSGLAPTNVIVTSEGDIKITDFGILSATLPPQPISVQRLAQRVPYLAPEQLANEATSAATDVFALGVIAYELVTGQRTFRGDTPQQVAQAIMAGPPAEPPLPRPIVRVLQRCLARSPFRAVPRCSRARRRSRCRAAGQRPVPGTRKDVGAQVKETLDRLATLHAGEMSGVVALNVGTQDRSASSIRCPASASRSTPRPTSSSVRRHPRPGPLCPG